MNDPSQVGEARRFALALALQIDFSETRQGRVGIVVNELGNNLVRYAKEGQLLIRRLSGEGPHGIEILAVDKGPGLDADLVMRDGFTTGRTPGTGLGAVRRQSDLFDLDSRPPGGTVAMSRIYRGDADARLRPAYEIGAINVPMPGEKVSGDGWCHGFRDDGVDLIVADGLGHGPAAHQTALEALHAFGQAHHLPPDQCLEAIHRRLKSTRGGAVFLMAVHPAKIDFAGVGNVRAIVQSASGSKTLISHNGTAGVQIRTVKPLSQPWNETDLLIVHSDGVNSRFDIKSYPGLQNRHPSLVAATIYRDHRRGTDDATVVVLRRTPR